MPCIASGENFYLTGQICCEGKAPEFQSKGFKDYSSGIVLQKPEILWSIET